MTPETDSLIAAYLSVEDQRRIEDVTVAMVAMTKRERRLVREAAVMGYVRGTLHGAATYGLDVPVPSDSAIFHEVVTCCRSMPDLYPTMAGLGAPRQLDTEEWTDADRG